jgi:hypothetical protein
MNAGEVGPSVHSSFTFTKPVIARENKGDIAFTLVHSLPKLSRKRANFQKGSEQGFEQTFERVL